MTDTEFIDFMGELVMAPDTVIRREHMMRALNMIASLKNYAQAQEDKYEREIATLKAKAEYLQKDNADRYAQIKELNRINIAIQESWDDCKTTADRLRGIIKEHDRTIQIAHYRLVTLQERIKELEEALEKIVDPMTDALSFIKHTAKAALGKEKP